MLHVPQEVLKHDNTSLSLIFNTWIFRFRFVMNSEKKWEGYGDGYSSCNSGPNEISVFGKKKTTNSPEIHGKDLVPAS